MARTGPPRSARARRIPRSRARAPAPPVEPAGGVAAALSARVSGVERLKPRMHTDEHGFKTNAMISSAGKSHAHAGLRNAVLRGLVRPLRLSVLLLSASICVHPWFQRDS